MLKKTLIIIFLICVIILTNCRSIKERPQGKLLSPPLMNLDDDFTDIDSVTMYATDVYRGGIFKRTFQGTGYRNAWKLPIKIPVVYLENLAGGLTPIERGGGNQTLSMDLSNPSGDIYTLRSVNKDPSELAPDWANKLNIDNLVTDAISAGHPYGALPARALADAMNILNSSPQLVFVPKQIALDSFNADFGGRMFFLEYEPEGKGEWINRPNVQKIVDTENAQQILVKYSDAKIDQAALLRARFLDIVMGDWDRHAKQWGWVVMKKDSSYLLEPLATDRDNVFYNVGGIFPWIVTRPAFTPFLRPHRKKVDYFVGLVKDFDTYFLYDTPVESFVSAAKKLKEDLTDEVIDEAFSVWPQNFRDEDGAKIISRIKARRDKLEKYALKFHKSIRKKGPLTAPIKGSDKMYVRKN